jgi:acyl carrier protein
MKYTDEQILEKVTGIMAELFEVNPANVKLESRLNDDLGLDSIDAIDLITHLQGFVGQRLHPEEFKSVRTISDLIAAAQITLSKANVPPQPDVQ